MTNAETSIYKQGRRVKSRTNMDHTASTAPPHPLRHQRRVAGGALLLLTLVYTLNIADRYVCSTLMEAIKADFALSDGMTGLVTGSALALFYVIAGLPLGAMADSGNRKRIIIISLAVWSAFTMLSGLALRLPLFIMARVGVGIAEAGAGPAAQSILADLYRPANRGFAMSILATGAALGAALGSLGGGNLSAMLGWRATLMVFGAFGIPLAIVLLLALKEPQRGAADIGNMPQPASSAAAAAEQAGMPRYADLLRLIAADPALRHLLAGATVVTFWGWGLLWWTPAFLGRSMGMDVAASGSLLGPMHLAGGLGVSAATAFILHRLAPSGPPAQARFLTISTLMATLPALLAFTATGHTMTTAMLWLFVPLIYAYIGPAGALSQTLVPATMRARFAALILLATNIANLVLAPWIIGTLSDLIAPFLAKPQESLRYALAITACTGPWAAWHFWRLDRCLRLQETGK